MLFACFNGYLFMRHDAETPILSAINIAVKNALPYILLSLFFFYIQQCLQL